MLCSSFFSRNVRFNKFNLRPRLVNTFFIKKKPNRSFFSKLKNGKLSTRSYTSTASLPPFILNVPPTQISTLPSKLRVATEETFGETATIGVFIDSGSVYENEKNNGVAHFLEHMSFKVRTEKRLFWSNKIFKISFFFRELKRDPEFN